MTMKVVPVWLLLFLSIMQCKRAADAETKKSGNAEEFAVLCSLIKLTEAPQPAAAEPPEIAQVVKELTAINFTIIEEAARQVVEANKHKSWAEIKSQHTGATAYYGDNWEEWTRVAKLNPDDAEAKILARWRKHKNNSATRHRLAALLEEARALQTSATSHKAGLKADGLESDLNKALYGDGGKAAELKATGGTRKAACGTGSTGGPTKGTMAGTSLYFDLLCLCAGEGTDTNAGQACCETCNSAGNSNAWTVTDDGKRRAEAIAQQCPPYLTPDQLTAEALTTRMANFFKKANQHKGNTQAEKFVLGYMSGNGADGCTGKASGANEGPCVMYDEDMILKGGHSLKWYTHLKAAVAKAQTRKQASRALEAIAIKLKAVNTTAHQLLYASPESAEKQQAVEKDAGVTQGSRSEEDCNKAKDDKVECDKLEKQGCVFNKDGKAGEKCTLSENAKKQQKKLQTKAQKGKMEKLTALVTRIRQLVKKRTRPAKPPFVAGEKVKKVKQIKIKKSAEMVVF
uniref:B-VSG n=1 Tax=Trypanosoma brucei brucei (strain 927/4 GUTat10.1) TaxID=185431 RepID=G1CRN0_TRYB2|nr:b-VSG [Trypanosoma brucei brucei TREU927]